MYRCAITLLVSIFIPLTTFAQPTYPPYPDVWGYDLSEYQAVRDYENNLFNSYKLDDGDYIITFCSKLKRNPFISSSILLNFFKGTKRELDDDSFCKAKLNIHSKRLPYEYGPKVTFSNGNTLETEGDSFTRACTQDPIESYHLVLRDKNGKELKRYSVLLAMPTIQKVEEVNESPECYQPPSKNGHIYKQLFTLSYQIIGLEDDTFILYSHNNLIVRLDQNFKTKFHPKVNYRTRHGKILKRNLFIVPFEEISKICLDVYKKETLGLQGVQDEIINYLIENYND